jgi:RNA polymerase-interacting CarD/CdnL/TRCF family regulator
MNQAKEKSHREEKVRRKDPVSPEKVEFKEGTLLFHSAHGPFRVKGVLRKPELGGDGLCYWLEPDRRQRLGTRFFIAVNQIQKAGFHPPVSQGEAEKLLEYLRNGDELKPGTSKERIKEICSLLQENTPWAFTKILFILSHANTNEQSREEREALQRSVQGLTAELAYVLKIPVKSAALRMRKSIGFSAHANQKVREALERVS